MLCRLGPTVRNRNTALFVSLDAIAFRIAGRIGRHVSPVILGLWEPCVSLERTGSNGRFATAIRVVGPHRDCANRRAGFDDAKARFVWDS